MLLGSWGRHQQAVPTAYKLALQGGLGGYQPPNKVQMFVWGKPGKLRSYRPGARQLSGLVPRSWQPGCRFRASKVASCAVPVLV